jgi:putative transposase
MADLQAVVMNDDALDDELQDGLLVGEGGIVQSFPNTLAEGRQLSHDLLGFGTLVA